MELADPRTVEALLAVHARIPRGRPRGWRPVTTVRLSMARCPIVKRCRCGVCCRCQENARWERIFNERFADPEYYKERPAPCGSSLGWLR
jgi:hypothetical protein